MVKKATKEKLKLTTQKRKITGRKVKKLRREGILPANIYGKNVKSLAVQLQLKSFLPVYQQVGKTGLVELKVEGEEKPRPVLIHNVQLYPVTDQPIHADFYQVSLKEKVTASVPVELVGESLAVKEKIGILIQPLGEIEVEALPTDLPEKIDVDISGLKNVDEAVVVGDIKFPGEIKVLTETNQILVKIEPPAKEEEVAPPPAEEVPTEEAVREEKPAEVEEEKSPGKEETSTKEA